MLSKILKNNFFRWDNFLRRNFATDNINFYLYIYFACLSVCPFTYPINVKTAKPIGPKFCVGPHMTPGKVYRFMDSQNYKNFCPKVLDFCKFWKCAKKNLNSANFFLIFILYCTKREKCSEIKPHLKFELKDGRPKILV